MEPDIFQKEPSREFYNIMAEIRIGKGFSYQIQRQHGFIRAAVVTPASANWISPILVDDLDNFETLLQHGTELIVSNSRPHTPGTRNFKCLKGNV